MELWDNQVCLCRYVFIILGLPEFQMRLFWLLLVPSWCFLFLFPGSVAQVQLCIIRCIILFWWSWAVWLTTEEAFISAFTWLRLINNHCLSLKCLFWCKPNFNPFTPESDQCQNSPAASQEIMTSHSMENLTFHSLLRWKVIILQILTTSLIQLLFERLGEYTFWAQEWKG